MALHQIADGQIAKSQNVNSHIADSKNVDFQIVTIKMSK
jgi:hypothetical protein